MRRYIGKYANIYTARRAAAAVLLAAMLCGAGCAGRSDTFVEISAAEGQVAGDGTFVAIDGYATPAPIVTPAPTAAPTPTPEPTRRPSREEDREEEEEREEDRKEEEEREPEPKPTEEPRKSSTPYADSFSRVSVKYEEGGKGISFDTTTLGGEGISDSIFGRADITMVTVWTRT